MSGIILLVWVLCAVLCFTQAKQKNLNVGLWTFLGLFFGVFAVIGVLLQKERPAA